MRTILEAKRVWIFLWNVTKRIFTCVRQACVRDGRCLQMCFVESTRVRGVTDLRLCCGHCRLLNRGKEAAVPLPELEVVVVPWGLYDLPESS